MHLDPHSLALETFAAANVRIIAGWFHDRYPALASLKPSMKSALHEWQTAVVDVVVVEVAVAVVVVVVVIVTLVLVVVVAVVVVIVVVVVLRLVLTLSTRPHSLQPISFWARTWTS